MSIGKQAEKGLSLFATGFGIGNRVKNMPGTVGSLLGIPIALAIRPLPYIGFLLIAALAYLAADYEGKKKKDHDHPSIVCDEIVGILPPLLCVSIFYWPIVFLIFRLFDIIKPWPLSWVDNNIKGALGCLLDDIFAGLITWFFMMLIIQI